VVQDGMDILGGAGICMGKDNFLGSAYMAMPVAITVEGANIMTRSFQIIGQGLTRCHPHMLPLIDSLQSSDADAPAKFRTQFGRMLHHVFTNLGYSFARGVKSSVTTAFRSADAYKDADSLISYHEEQMLRLSANFAFAADLALLLGGRLKFEELLMGRLSDAMGAIYLGYATLHHFSRHKHVKGLNALAESAMLQLEVEAQEALREASENFPKPLGAFGGLLMSAGVSPLGGLFRPYRPPSDALTKQVAALLTNPSEVHDLFSSNIYLSPDVQNNRIAGLIHAMPICVEADKALTACKKEKRQPTVAEAAIIEQANSLRDRLIQVDEHGAVGSLEEQDASYTRPALTSTAARLQAAGTANFGQAVAASA